MAVLLYLPQNLVSNKQLKIICSSKRCLRCNTLYFDTHNSPSACSFHGHTTGEKGLFSLAPPHQGIDGEWSDACVRNYCLQRVIHQTLDLQIGRKDGAVVLSMMKMHLRHVCYDDGYTLY